ncbi:cell division control protein [Chytriomyces cf. hyalinus JEL632]|nr:cell division control protein [Chytriomyces cf. hyalinus JEL632]
MFKTWRKQTSSHTAAATPLKCVVVGDNNVGKNTLLAAYVDNRFPSEYMPRVFHDYPISVSQTTGKEPCDLRIFCTSGQADYPRLRHLFYPDTGIFLVCFSVVNPNSLQNVQELWFPELQHCCPDVPCILVGTQTDLRNDTAKLAALEEKKLRPATREVGQAMAKKLGAVKYVECSALTLDGVSTVFQEAAAIRRHLR